MTSAQQPVEPSFGVWQRQYKNRWITYSEPEQAKINVAYVNGKNFVDLSGEDPSKLYINLNVLKQINRVSGLQREVCRLRNYLDDSAFLVFLWQYQHKQDTDKWMDYPEEVQVYLNRAFLAEKKCIRLFRGDPKRDAEIHFHTMMQRNLGSKRKQQKVRCAIFNHGFYVWQREMLDLSIHCYPAAIALAAEAAYQRKESKLLYYYKQDYEIDLSSWYESSEDNDDGVAQMVSRVKSDRVSRMGQP